MNRRWNVYVTRMLPEDVMAFLQENFEVEVNREDRPPTRAELLENVKGKDAVLCQLNDIIDDAVFAAAGPQCKVFANYAVGFNNIDLAAATRRGVVVTNTPDVLTDATADLAWALLFAAARRLGAAERFLRAGNFAGWAPLMYLGQDITGKTLGVIGAGRIGANFAKKAKAFSMKVLYHGPNPKPEFEAETGAEFVDLPSLLRQADFVALHVPLMPSTKHLIGAEELALMKKSAIIINTSRGAIIDEAALVKALRQKTIWGAGLDVFENEPLLAAGLTELDNVVLLPHIGSATVDTRTNMGMLAARNILAVANGQQPPNKVN